jgi:glycosyltransferase involved in cell wall biosynthesis
VPNGDLPNYYASADLFVGPSIVTREGQEEGQGVVFLEAFAARLCVLTTRTGGIEDVIEDGRTGVLVDPGDPGLLAVTIEQLLSDERRRQVLADNAYREAITGYSWRTISDSFLAAYQFAAKCADLNAKTR